MNELLSLLKRSFEGKGYCQGDYEDAAKAVVWLEAHGMNGLELIDSTWSSLPADGGIGIEIIADEPGTKVLDAHDGNTAFCGRMAIDLACASAATERQARIEIRRCHGRRAILASLSACAARELYAIAFWYDKDSLHMASIGSRQPRPSYRSLQKQHGDNSWAATLVIVCSRSRQPIDAIAAELAGRGTNYAVIAEVSSTDMQTHYDKAIRQGLCVDSILVRTLTETADQVLVEATEQSRLGAGESQS